MQRQFELLWISKKTMILSIFIPFSIQFGKIIMYVAYDFFVKDFLILIVHANHTIALNVSYDRKPHQYFV